MPDKNWPSGNSYLRLVNSLQAEPKKVMTLYTQQVSELQLVLEAIQTLQKRTCGGEVKLRCLTEIRLSLVGSKEMSS